MIDPGHSSISIRRQCELVGLNRSSYYMQPAGESAFNLMLMRLMDEQYLKTPFYGYRRMTAWLRRQNYPVNAKRVARLMRKMGIQAISPAPGTTKPAPGHRIYPYLLRGVSITRPNQVWSADITYIPLAQGFMYLTAVIDWFSRYILAWELSNSLDGRFCVAALERALQEYGRPEIFNTDQGVQFTAQAFVSRLQAAGIRISMDGRGRALDNIFIERFWRTIKYEHVYLYDYEDVPALHTGLGSYIFFYNRERPHQSLDYAVPAEAYGLAGAASG